MSPSQESATITVMHNADAVMAALQVMVEAAEAFREETTKPSGPGPGNTFMAQVGSVEPLTQYRDLASRIVGLATEHGLLVPSDAIT